jgi:hypothetical protein
VDEAARVYDGETFFIDGDKVANGRYTKFVWSAGGDRVLLSLFPPA